MSEPNEILRQILENDVKILEMSEHPIMASHIKMVFEVLDRYNERTEKLEKIEQIINQPFGKGYEETFRDIREVLENEK